MKNFLNKQLVYLILSITLMYSCAPKGFITSSDNTIIHEKSKMVFPMQVGYFYRTSPHIYDKSGDNISVGYNIRTASCNLTITMYVYPHFNSSLESELDEIKNAIEHVHKENEMVLENKINHIQENLSVNGKQVLYEVIDSYDGNSTERYTMAYLFIHGDWFYKYRITYPKAYLDCANSEIDKLINMLSWPEY